MLLIFATGPVDFYISVNGSDSNSGLSPNTPFETIAHAWSVAQNGWHFRGNPVTFHLGAGVHTCGLYAELPLLGCTGGIGITGDPNGGTEVVTSGNCFTSGNGAAYTIRHMKLSSTGGTCAYAGHYGYLIIGQGIEFGNSPQWHIAAGQHSIIHLSADYSISGSAGNHFFAGEHSLITNSTIPVHVTVAGGLSFVAFASAQDHSTIKPIGMTFSNKNVGGPNYWGMACGLFNTGSSDPNFFPGNGTHYNDGTAVYL